jgi:predicted hydrocarbon binding protein
MCAFRKRKNSLSGTREFYEIDESEGILVNKRLGHRAFVLGLAPWTALIEQLSNTFGSGAEVILFGIGKSYGLSAAQEEKRTDVDRKLTVNLLARIATLSGWGKITISRNSPEYLTVKVQRCVFCASIKDPNEKQVPCFFLRGIISGFAEVLLGPNKIEEVHCDQDFCEFRVSLD